MASARSGGRKARWVSASIIVKVGRRGHGDRCVELKTVRTAGMQPKRTLALRRGVAIVSEEPRAELVLTARLWMIDECFLRHGIACNPGRKPLQIGRQNILRAVPRVSNLLSQRVQSLRGAHVLMDLPLVSRSAQTPKPQYGNCYDGDCGGQQRPGISTHALPSTGMPFFCTAPM